MLNLAASLAQVAQIWHSDPAGKNRRAHALGWSPAGIPMGESLHLRTRQIDLQACSRLTLHGFVGSEPFRVQG